MGVSWVSGGERQEGRSGGEGGGGGRKVLGKSE